MKRILLLAAVFLLPLAACSGQDELRLGTGNSSGNYYSYGAELVETVQADHQNIKCKLCETAGSAANLRLLEEGYLQLAFAQSDMLQDAAAGTGSFQQAHTNYAAIAGLYTEACQIVVPASSEIQSVSDLFGKRVSIGEEESGVLQNAKRILFAYGLDETMIQPSYLSFTDSAQALQEGNLDAFFCTAGAPTPAVAELAATVPVRLLAIGTEQAERIISQYGGYTRYTVKANTYPGQETDIPVLGVKTVLVADKQLSEETVEQITASLFAHEETLLAGIGIEETTGLAFATEEIPIAFHKGAARYYADNGVQVAKSQPAGTRS